jgi:hypothetical protein
LQWQRPHSQQLRKAFHAPVLLQCNPVHLIGSAACCSQLDCNIILEASCASLVAAAATRPADPPAIVDNSKGTAANHLQQLHCITSWGNQVILNALMLAPTPAALPGLVSAAGPGHAPLAYDLCLLLLLLLKVMHAAAWMRVKVSHVELALAQAAGLGKAPVAGNC